MRARYSAYEKCEVDFLINSLHPDSGGVDRDSTRAWAENAEWHGLELLSVQAGGQKDETGEVEFVAKYSMKGVPQRHHEKAAFKRHEGKWLYLEGAEIHPPPAVGPRVRVGRNDACVCGSEKKFKKCCRVTFETGATDPEKLVRARFAAPLVGEGRFLLQSLHPDALQSAGDIPEEPPVRLSLERVAESSGNAVADVTLFAGEGAEGVAASYKLSKAGDRWLFVGSA